MNNINRVKMRARFLFLAVAVSIFQLSCSTPKAEQQSSHEDVSVEVFEEKLKTDVQLIDVRTAAEYAAGHIAKSHNVDIGSEYWNSEMAKFDKSKPVLVYCKSGGRSADAVEKLVIAGFKTVYNLQGGIMKWQAEGKSVEQSKVVETSNEMTLADYNQLVKDANFVLVDFNATWCGPCKQLSPILDKIVATKKDKLKLIKVDADQNQNLCIAKGIDGIPYLELFKNGKLVWSYKGFIDEENLLKEFKTLKL